MTKKISSATPPTYTMILDQSAHMDWDWINTFGRNYWCYSTDSNGSAYGVNEIIARGIENAQKYPQYYYTVCEMGFFRQFLEVNPHQVDAIKALGNRFQVISGGITSAENLICSSEGFIRNYLIGQHWLRQTTTIEPKPHCWLPDDFGQGPELPSLLKALGFVSVAFARLPGSYKSSCTEQPMQDLIDHGVDFKWEAADGSSLFAHWLVGGYPFGNQLSSTDPACGGQNALECFITAYGKKDSNPLPLYTAAPTGYMYISIDNDFSLPIEGLGDYIKTWNDSQSEQGAARSNVTMKQGTFDELVSAATQPQNASKLLTRRYNGTPFFTGYYASRPGLKILHFEATRALVGAEVIGLLTQPSNKKVKSMLPTDFWTRLDQVWDDFTPSTHHDYVVGTAPDAVYIGEQLPRLQGVAAIARSLRTVALNALGGMISTQTNDNENVIVANSLGFARTGIAEISGIEPFSDGEIQWPTQPTAEGGMLVYTSVPSFGYVTSVGSEQINVIGTTISPTGSGEAAYTISNEFISATVSAQAGWGLTSLIDIKNNNQELLRGVGNAVTFYDDSQKGSIYQFSSEYTGSTMPVITDVTVTTDGAGLGALVRETGPLRTRLRTEVSMAFTFPSTDDSIQFIRRFVREYELRAGEPYLRMTTTGAAPPNTSVMTSFTFNEPVSQIVHGTGYHWTNVQPLPDHGSPPIFRPTHDFLISQDSTGTALAAVYHSAMPAWAPDATGTLVGCLLRNTPQQAGHGAKGSDPAAHTQHYALRVPTGFAGPETGQPLREAQGFHTPLVATRLPDGISYDGQLATGQTASLASVISDGATILTAAKPGTYDSASLVLRLYQPTNAAASVRVQLSSAPSAAKLVTATETEWSGEEIVDVGGAGVITVPMTGALATVSVEGLY